jgi:tetratricopeptide (TPR) repeat protein
VPGGVERVLGAYRSVLTGKLSYIVPLPLTRQLMRRVGVQDGIARYYHRSSHTWANKGDYDEAIRACRASIAVQPDNIAPYEVLVQVLAHLQRYEEALEACVDALAVSPDSEAISASLRQILPHVSQSKQPQRVIGNLQKGLAASPVRSDLLTLLIEMLTRSHRYVEAVQACQRTLEADPEFFPAADTIRNLLKDPAAKQALANVDVPAPTSMSEEYDWLVASNVIETLLGIMSKFYGKLGIDPHIVPLVQGLERSRQKLAAARPPMEPASDQSTLVLFERAWQNYCSGQTGEAHAAFEKILSDGKARQRAAYNPFLKEALVRAGEILGRNYDKLGDVERAINIYKEVLSVDPDSLVARRLIVLLSRSGQLSEAVKFAETAITSRPNLYRQVPPNRHIAAVKAELFLKPEGG